MHEMWSRTAATGRGAPRVGRVDSSRPRREPAPTANPDPSNPPDGLIAHFGGPDPKGGWRVTDVWESEAQWERFRDETLVAAVQEIQAPPFDSAVGELHNKIVSQLVTA